MICSVYSAAIAGVEAVPVVVEADACAGLPMISIIGSVTAQVREAQDRVRTALKNNGILIPPRRITINLSPGDLRKNGTRFDLPIAAAVLGALGEVNPAVLEDTMILGELQLSGKVTRVPGVLPAVLKARDEGLLRCIVPPDNLAEARIVEGIESFCVDSLGELLSFAREGIISEPPLPSEKDQNEEDSYPVDFSDIRGQARMKRCALIAAAGFHNLLFSGPPGAGKSMAARRIPTILPRLSGEERLEISKLYSIAGLLPPGEPLLRHRPFRDPHHSLTPAALCGGGKYPVPGEVTLAHRGVLFLDELPELKRDTLEMLRQPLEDRFIMLSRVGVTYRFPASFLLVAAMNPCPCGWYPDRNRCRCTEAEIGAYRRRVSQAFMDRIDLQCEVEPVTYADLTGSVSGELSSEQMRCGVEQAVGIQKERYRGTGICFNSELGASVTGYYCSLTRDAASMLKAAFDALGLSARGYHHILRVGRTIADLEGSDRICEAHISEAICFRCGN